MAETQANTTLQKANVVVGDRGIQLRSIEEMFRFSEAVHRSGLAPKGMIRSEQILVAIQIGMEAGLTPMRSLSSVVVVNGRPSWMGDAALGLVNHSGCCDGEITVDYTGTDGKDDWTCHVSSHRVGHSERREHTFSVADAKRAKLWGKAGPWTEYPQRMLYYRAMGFHLRDAYSDVLLGLAVEAEVRDYPEDGTVHGEEHAAAAAAKIREGATPKPKPKPRKKVAAKQTPPPEPDLEPEAEEPPAREWNGKEMIAAIMARDHDEKFAKAWIQCWILHGDEKVSDVEFRKAAILAIEAGQVLDELLPAKKAAMKIGPEESISQQNEKPPVGKSAIPDEPTEPDHVDEAPADDESTEPGEPVLDSDWYEGS